MEGEGAIRGSGGWGSHEGVEGGGAIRGSGGWGSHKREWRVGEP